MRRAALMVALCLMAAACGGDGDSANTAALVRVPDVVGQSADYARGVLDAAGLITDVIETSAGGVIGQVTEQVPAAGTQVEAGSSVVIKVPASTTTTTTLPETTTTTVDPVYELALPYFTLLARDNPASLREAADSAVTLAADYANYLAAAYGEGSTGELGEDSGVITICYPAGSGAAEQCVEYSDFSLNMGKLAHFSVDGRPLRTRLWPTPYLRQWGHAWCSRVHPSDECNGADSELDRELFIFTESAYISTAGSTVLVWDVITGAKDLDVIHNQDGTWASFLTDSEGVKHFATDCFSTLAVGSSLGLRINREQRGYLTCAFPGLEQPGVNTKSTVTLVVDWGGSNEFEFDLKDLPD